MFNKKAKDYYHIIYFLLLLFVLFTIFYFYFMYLFNTNICFIAHYLI